MSKTPGRMFLYIGAKEGSKNLQRRKQRQRRWGIAHDPDFQTVMQSYRKIARRYRNTFRELAK
jgi:hypothetical protein